MPLSSQNLRLIKTVNVILCVFYYNNNNKKYTEKPPECKVPVTMGLFHFFMSDTELLAGTVHVR